MSKRLTLRLPAPPAEPPKPLQPSIEDRSLELPPIVSCVRSFFSGATNPGSNAGSVPGDLAKAASPQRAHHSSSRRSHHHHRNRSRKPTTFPARGQFFPAVQFADVPNAPSGCLWAPTTLNLVGLKWASEARMPADVFKLDPGTAIHIARALHRGDVIPGWSFGQGDCQISWGGQAMTILGLGRVQVLEGPRLNFLVWQPWKKEIPSGALRAGRTYDGEDLYLGRCSIRGRTFYGRFQKSYGALLVSAGRCEIVCHENFDLLMEKTS